MSPYFRRRKLHQDVWKERQEEEITKFQNIDSNLSDQTASMLYMFAL